MNHFHFCQPSSHIPKNQNSYSMRNTKKKKNNKSGGKKCPIHYDLLPIQSSPAPHIHHNSPLQSPRGRILPLSSLLPPAPRDDDVPKKDALMRDSGPTTW